MTRVTRFIAFGVIRASATDYHWASRDRAGTVRFHQTRAAASRYGQVERALIATAEEVAADRRAAREEKAAREARLAAAFDAMPRAVRADISAAAAKLGEAL